MRQVCSWVGRSEARWWRPKPALGVPLVAKTTRNRPVLKQVGPLPPRHPAQKKGPQSAALVHGTGLVADRRAKQPSYRQLCTAARCCAWELDMGTQKRGKQHASKRAPAPGARINGKKMAKNIRVQEAGAKHPLPVTSNEVEYPGIEPRS